MKFYDFLIRILNYCRVNVIVVIAGGLFLLFVDQGAEITVRLGEGFWRPLFSIAAITFWAWQSWFWSRIILNNRFPNIHPPRSRSRVNVIDWFPRTLGGLAFILAILSMYRNDVVGLGFGVLVGIAILSVLFWYYRRHIPRQIFGIDIPDLKPADFNQFTWSWFVFSALLVAGLAIWAIWWPVEMGFGLGSGAIVFAALASIAVTGNILVYWTREKGFPFVILFIAVAAFWSGVGWLDNHGVRPLQKIAALKYPPPPESLAAVLKDWNEKNKGNNRPFVVVATSGGGLRAAYWTATVLGALQDANPNFGNQLFAVSGVSGGSLGAVVFNGLLASEEKSCADLPPKYKLGEGSCFEALSQTALSRDFLAPSITAMMYGDLMQRFLPIFGFDDRAKALEMGWEHQWKHIVKNDRMAKGFRQSWASHDKWLPTLLLNGTHEETGRRMITSNLAIDKKYFPDAFDFFAKMPGGKFQFAPGEISAATAAHNSARFAYISPAGTLRTGGHVLDGGYYENYGAQTLDELLEAVLSGPETIKQGKKTGAAPRAAKRPILVIQITNEPDSVDALNVDKPAGAGAMTSRLNETTAPILGLLNTREARGVSAAKKLRRKYKTPTTKKGGTSPVAGRKTYYAHFRLHDPMKKDNRKKHSDPKIALGWVLSQESECSMRVQLRAVPDNRMAFAKVTDLLHGRPFDPEGAPRVSTEALTKLCDISEQRMKEWSFIPGK